MPAKIYTAGINLGDEIQDKP